MLVGVEIGEFVDGPVGVEPQVLTDLVVGLCGLPPEGAGVFEPEVDPVDPADPVDSVGAVLGTEVQALS